MFQVRGAVSGVLMVISLVLIGLSFTDELAMNNMLSVIIGLMIGLVAFKLAPGGSNSGIVTPRKLKKINRINKYHNFVIHRIADVEYVSVFKQQVSATSLLSMMTRGDIQFKINVWYADNTFDTIYIASDQIIALGVGYNMAQKLEVKCLDATHGADQRWVDLAVPVEEYLNNL